MGHWKRDCHQWIAYRASQQTGGVAASANGGSNAGRVGGHSGHRGGSQSNQGNQGNQGGNQVNAYAEQQQFDTRGAYDGVGAVDLQGFPRGWV
jgi:hypothetical protein